jgi:hypothetical protein
LAINSSKSSGVGRPPARGNFHPRRGIGEKTVIRIIEELGLLALLDLFDEQAKLFLDLIIRLVVKVGDTGLHIENGGDRVQEIFARGRVIIDEGFRQITVPLPARAAFDIAEALSFLDLV